MGYTSIILGILKKPAVIVALVAAVIIGYQYFDIQLLEVKVSKLETQVEAVKVNYTTCKTNESSLLEAIEKQKKSITSLDGVIAGLQGQVEQEQKNSYEWEQKYKNRPVITKVKEVPVIKYVEKGLVVDEETSADYVDYINSLFD